MKIENKLIKEIMLFQEYASTIQYGEKETFTGINLAEVHCINAIGNLEQANVTKIAAKMRMTRGAISKINKKLLQRDLIESYQLPNNQKEIYYKLTAAGCKLYDVHAKCHMQSKQKKIAIIKTYTLEEQNVILKFLSDMNALFENKKGTENKKTVKKCKVAT